MKCSKNYYHYVPGWGNSGEICLVDFAFANGKRHEEKWLVSEFEIQMRGAINATID